MTAPSKVSGSPRPRITAGSPVKSRRYAVSDGAPVEVIEDGPSIAARLAWLAARLTIRPTLAIGSQLAFVPWPWGLVDFASRAMVPVAGTVRARVELAHCSAQLVRAKGVLPADGTHRVVLYLHGGAFVTCGVHSHGRLAALISKYADAPVLVLNYRTIPKHSVGQAIEDCSEAWDWLRARGYQPDQIVLAGDSAGGYLALALAERLLGDGEQPAALVSMSPLMQLAAAGVPTELRVWPGQMHVFQLCAPAVREATRSLRHIGRHIQAVSG